MSEQYVVIVGTKGDESQGAGEYVCGPFPRSEAYAFEAKVQAEFGKAEALYPERTRDKVFPYGEPYTKVAPMVDHTAMRAAANWYNDEPDDTTILQVQLGSVNEYEQQRLVGRFHRWYNVERGLVEYPVTHLSHAEDVYRDEFGDPGVSVDYAACISLPYPVEDFEPFTEESAGLELATLHDED